MVVNAVSGVSFGVRCIPPYAYRDAYVECTHPNGIPLFNEMPRFFGGRPHLFQHGAVAGVKNLRQRSLPRVQLLVLTSNLHI